MGVGIVIVVAVIVVIALFCIHLSNNIVRLSNRCDNAWDQINAQLKRRADLIPNLVETVKGYASHESDTLEAVIAARNGVVKATTPDEVMASNNVLTGALRQLFAVSESYPELKANANFQQLQNQLEETENKIVYARQSFNDCVLMFNNAIQTFPGSLFAGGRAPKKGFEISDADTQAPQVKF